MNQIKVYNLKGCHICVICRSNNCNSNFLSHKAYILIFKIILDLTYITKFKNNKNLFEY